MNTRHAKPLYILLLVIFVFTNPTRSYNGLESDLLRNYDKNSLPAKSTMVNMSFVILGLDLDPVAHSMTLHLWIKMFWSDPRLQWDTSKYPGGRKSVALPPDTVWTPDITLYNNAVSRDFDHIAKSKVLVQNGKIIWVPPTTVQAQCAMDLTYWPYDVHNCSAKFGTWVHDAYTLDLIVSDPGITVEDPSFDHETGAFKRTEWRLLNKTLVREEKRYSCCEEPYVDVEMTLLIERHSSVYTWIVTVPVIVLSLLTIMVFLLSPSSGEKIVLASVSLVGDLYFLINVSRIIGHCPSQTPLIVKFAANQFILTLVSLIASVIVIRVTREPFSKGIPRFIRGPLNSLSAFLLLESFREAATATHAHPGGKEETAMTEGAARGLLEAGADRCSKEWVLLGAFIDRICLIVYIFIFIIQVISFSSVL